MSSETKFTKALNSHPYYLYQLAQRQTITFEFIYPGVAAIVQKAHAEFVAGEKQQAVDKLNTILRLELLPRDRASILLVLSWFLLDHGDLAQAMLAAMKALEADGGNAAHWEYAAGLAVSQRDLDKALEYFQKSVALDCSRGFSWAAIALMHSLNDNLKEVIAPAQRAMALKTDRHPQLVAISAALAAIAAGDATDGLFDLSPLREPPVDDDFLDCLPDLQGISLHIENPRGSCIIFAACDPTYLTKYAVPLVWSLERLARPVTIHLHVYNPTVETTAIFAELEKKLRHVMLRGSEEIVNLDEYGEGPVYFSCARFCRAYQLLRANDLPVVAVDVDVLFRKPVSQLSGLLASDVDIGVMGRGSSPLWERVSGSCVIYKQTERSREYARLVASLVARNLESKKGLWFLDQICLYLAICAMKDRLRIDRDQDRISCDTRLRENAVMWTVTVQKDLDDPFNQFASSLVAEYTAAPEVAYE